MESLFMLLALGLMAFFVIGSLVSAYYYELLYFQQQLRQRLPDLLPERKMHHRKRS